MNVFETTTGKWYVDDGHMQHGPFKTNAEAWRCADRLAGEPVSKREDTAEWIANKDSSK